MVSGKEVIVGQRDGFIFLPKDVTAHLRGALQEEFSFFKRQMLQGKELREAKADNRSAVITQLVTCYTYDDDGVFVLPRGYLPRLCALLRKYGYRPKIRKRVVDPERQKRLEPDWDALFREVSSFRYKQKEMLLMMATRDVGCFDLPTGHGKSTVIRFAGLLFRKARIDVTCPKISVLEGIWENLCRQFGDVGMVGGGRNYVAPRINCYVTNSLHKSPANADMLFVDEVHKFGSDKRLEELARYCNAKVFGLSASIGKRFDGADFAIEGAVGPVLVRVPYQKAVEEEAVSDIEVHWHRIDPGDVYETNKVGVAKSRQFIWRNEFRNQKIAEIVREYAANHAQVLIYVSKTEHVFYLKKYLPEFTAVYGTNGLPPERRARYIRLRLISPDEPVITKNLLTQYRNQFRAGELKYVICTSVWSEGVDFPELTCLARADGGVSAIDNDQVPGRLSRLASGDGKKVLIDFEDVFEQSAHDRTRGRRSDYAKKGWKQFRRESDGTLTPIKVRQTDQSDNGSTVGRRDYPFGSGVR